MIGLAQASKIKQKEIVEYLIDIAVKFKLLDGDWKKRIEDIDSKIKELDDKRKAEAYEGLNEACPALAHTMKDGFICCLKAPRQVKLGDGGIEDMREICAACDRVKGLFEEARTLKESIAAGTLWKIPQCTNGGRINEEGDKLYCQIRGTWLNPETCLKVYRCEGKFLKWINVKIKPGK